MNYRQTMFAAKTRGARGRSALAAAYSTPATPAAAERRAAARQRAFEMMCDSFARERDAEIKGGGDYQEAWAKYTSRVEREAARDDD